MDLGGLSASGVTKLHDHPYLKLRGGGTMIAVIDSGIDYRHPAFRNGNQSRIVSIWDQSLPGDSSETAPFGQVFTKEDINRALESETVYAQTDRDFIVPLEDDRPLKFNPSRDGMKVKQTKCRPGKPFIVK